MLVIPLYFSTSGGLDIIDPGFLPSAATDQIPLAATPVVLTWRPDQNISLPLGRYRQEQVDYVAVFARISGDVFGFELRQICLSSYSPPLHSDTLYGED